jgi:16S rRNA (uracil1498-N3)-methyltransferase
MSATPRLYVTSDLVAEELLNIEGDQAHYLGQVLRLSEGHAVRVFNGRQGEFETTIERVHKRTISLRVDNKIREQFAPTDLWLLFAPLKKARTDFVVEKAVELGVSEIHPVITERTDAGTVRTDRLQRLAIEAAEQTERLDVPPVRAAVKLAQALADWDPGRALFYADESGDDGAKPWGGDSGRAPAIADVLHQQDYRSAAILVGPEGGFTAAERAWLRAMPQVTPMSLGPRILRAETAAVAALSLWQALCGDWAK